MYFCWNWPGKPILESLGLHNVCSYSYSFVLPLKNDKHKHTICKINNINKHVNTKQERVQEITKQP